MNNKFVGAALGVVMTALCAAPAHAADEATLSRDLTAVIQSQGLPCGKITRVNTQADRDYLVACQDGSNYQIAADSQGNLIAHTLGQKIH